MISHGGGGDFPYYVNNLMGFIDIEQDTSYGWFSSNQDGDRKVFQGFSDYLGGKTSVDSHCGGLNQYPLQPGVYSSSSNWSYAMGAYNIPNSEIWTNENCCSITYPGSFTGGAGAQWFGGQTQDFAWQFNEGTGADYDIAIEPIYMPYFQASFG